MAPLLRSRSKYTSRYVPFIGRQPLSRLVLFCISLIACRSEAPAQRGAELLPQGGVSGNSIQPTSPAPSSVPVFAPRAPVVLILGGDVELGRRMGQILLRDPLVNPLELLAPWFQRADLRFINLEGPLSDQKGETVSPRNRLVFTGPPAGAEVLARAGIDVVSTANNHAWDYGKSALLETLLYLDRAKVLHVGTGSELASAQAPVVLERHGMKIGFLAVTDVWNQGPLAQHPGREYVAAADEIWLFPAIRSLKERGVDRVVVSYHGGEEYQHAPLLSTKRWLRAVVEAGADLVVGHHPHMLQGIGWHRGRPILFSLGNLLMQMHRDHPWTGLGMVARVRFDPDRNDSLEVCPFRMVGLEPQPIHREANAKKQWEIFARRLHFLSVYTGKIRLDKPGEDGCAAVSPVELIEKFLSEESRAHPHLCKLERDGNHALSLLALFFFLACSYGTSI